MTLDDFIFGEPVLASAVPEPSSWAVMLLGFAGIGLSLRQRKRVFTTDAAQARN